MEDRSWYLINRYGIILKRVDKISHNFNNFLDLNFIKNEYLTNFQHKYDDYKDFEDNYLHDFTRSILIHIFFMDGFTSNKQDKIIDYVMSSKNIGDYDHLLKFVYTLKEKPINSPISYHLPSDFIYSLTLLVTDFIDLKVIDFRTNEEKIKHIDRMFKGMLIENISNEFNRYLNIFLLTENIYDLRNIIKLIKDITKNCN